VEGIFSEGGLSREMRSMLKDSYVCRHCGYVRPREEAKISGWDSEHSLRHIHCPRCGKIVTHAP